MVDTRLRTSEPATLASEIAAELARLLATRHHRVEHHGAQFAELWHLAMECLTGGKLLRPRLLVGAFDALTEGYPDAAKRRDVALEVAAALEILHFAFLIHDDLIDDDLVRRGEPNLIGRLLHRSDEDDRSGTADSQLHWARSSALLIGDLMLTIAHQVIARARLSEVQRLRLLDLLDITITETVAGEFADVGLADSRLTPDLSTVLEMTRMKTASYTFEFPLRAAAIIAGADPLIEQRLGEVGGRLGIAFQLQDDLLSAFGDSALHGKDQFSDFREGKETALIAYARMTPVWDELNALHGAPAFVHASGARIQHLLEECGARSYIESLIREHFALAKAKLACESHAAPAAVRKFLLTLIGTLEGRTQ